MAFGAALAAPGLIPGAIAAGGAHYFGSRLRGDSHSDATSGAVGEGLLTGAMGSVVKIPKALGGLARRAVKGGLKIDRGYLEQMATARKQGLIGAEDEIVDTVLNERVNPVTLKGGDALQKSIDETAALREAKIKAAPDQPVLHSGPVGFRRLEKTLGESLHETGSPSREPTRKLMDEMLANPLYGQKTGAATVRDMTPRELAKRVEKDNDLLRGMFGDKAAAGVEGVKSVRNVNAAMLNRAAGTRPESQRLKKLIDLRNVSNVARRRAEARDVVGITDLVSLSAGRPIVLGATTAMRPAAQVGLGLGMNAVSRHIPLRGTAPERAILQELMRAFAAGDNAR